MSTHVLRQLKQEDVLTKQQIRTLADAVVYNRNLVAYAIMGYADRLVYACVKCLESDIKLEPKAIEKFIDADNIKITNDVYSILQIVKEEFGKIKTVKMQKVDFREIIDKLVKNTPPEAFERIRKAMEILKEDFKKQEEQLYTKKLMEWIKKENK